MFDDIQGYLHRDMFYDILTTRGIGAFFVKIQLFVTAKFDQDPDPHWFSCLDPDPDTLKSTVAQTDLSLDCLSLRSISVLRACPIFLKSRSPVSVSIPGQIVYF